MTVYGYSGDALFQLHDYVGAAKQYSEAISIAKARNNTIALASYEARQKKADAFALATPTASAATNSPTAEATSTETATQEVTAQPRQRLHLTTHP
jgi:hypothetical protein